MKVDILKEIEKTDREIAQLNEKKQALQQAAKYLESTDLVATNTAQSATKPQRTTKSAKKRPKQAAGGRKNATELIRQYFLDNDNAQAGKADIARKTDLSPGTVQNVLMKDGSGYEKIALSPRKVVWRMLPLLFKEAKKQA